MQRVNALGRRGAMSETYELTRRIVSRGTFKTMSAVRFRKQGGMPIFSGDTRTGYLTPEVRFAAADNRPSISFGPNRSFAPTSHCLKNGEGGLIAEIRHGFVQSLLGGKRFAVIDAEGIPLFELVSGRTLKVGKDQLTGARLSDELYAVRGKDILGHTVSETEAANARGAMAKATRRLGRIAAELPGVLTDIFKEEVLGKSVERKEAIVARFTLLKSATLEPHVIFAILMFKVHYHDMRTF